MVTSVVIAGGVPGLDGGALPPPAGTVIAGCVLVADMIGAAAHTGLMLMGLLQITSSIRSICYSLSLSSSLQPSWSLMLYACISSATSASTGSPVTWSGLTWYHAPWYMHTAYAFLF
jgi:hypothetical protein